MAIRYCFSAWLGKTKNKKEASCIICENKPYSSGTRKTKTAQVPHPTGTVKEILTRNDVTNAEILWCLKMVDKHFSYNSCSDLANLFQCMFAGSEVAQHFLLGKTKCKYLILYRIVPYCKSELLKYINSLPFFFLLFEKGLNSVLQKCKMNVNIRF